MIAKQTSKRNSHKAVTKGDIVPKSKGVEKGHYMSKSSTRGQTATGSRFSVLYDTLVVEITEKDQEELDLDVNHLTPNQDPVPPDHVLGSEGKQFTSTHKVPGTTNFHSNRVASSADIVASISLSSRKSIVAAVVGSHQLVVGRAGVGIIEARKVSDGIEIFYLDGGMAIAPPNGGFHDDEQLPNSSTDMGDGDVSNYGAIVCCQEGVADVGVSSLRYSSSPFQFQAAWLSHPSFLKVVQSVWRGHHSFVKGLGSLQTTLKSWNQNVFSNIYQRMHRLLARLKGIQCVMNSKKHAGLRALELKLKKDLDLVLDQEEIVWFQKSRERWIIYGDRNTAFFHASAVLKGSKKRISRLKDSNGTSLPLRFPVISSSDLEFISSPFTVEEVKSALWDMDSYKAPGPDVFQVAFFQKSWTIVGVDLVNMALFFLMVVLY
ncbi:hypothetical protein GH714_041553 [Hevea brasiliensis]|uniref:Uncharacterized protein n=1 Tax=Hevea brasiliensis TaxID=3981 RepID=A0A6A6MQP6_HEVBR|nr:hypothetical protein GH714_041553 [Hevea brasiliensis]